jgi:tetratricopeptide (TPR) repeat protein
MKVKNYSSAKFYYRTASDILKWETYPLQQLKEIDKIIAAKLSESDQRQFTENLNKGDQAFNNGEYPTARFFYNKAIEISPSDHVTSQLKEIESIVNGTDSKKNNAAYDDFIKKGDEAVKQKNSSIARFYFQKASALKPNENYPKEELKKINSGADNL